METSEKRKERLRAMRMEATEAEASNSGTSSDVPGYLSNPLVDDNAVQEEPCAPSRFGFYTDPMAGWSSDTKRSKVADQIASNSFKHSNAGRPRNPEMPPPPHHYQSNYSPDQRLHQQNFGPRRNPVGMMRPFATHHGNPPEIWNGAGGATGYRVPSDPPREGRYPGPRFRPPGSPGFGPPGSPGFGPPGSPGFGPSGYPRFQPSGSPAFEPPGVPGFGPPGVPGFGPPGSPGFGSNTWQGGGHRLSHSPSPHSIHGGSFSPSSSSGRGRGHSQSGGRGGRGRGSNGPPFAPEQLYNASMVEVDPWRGLSPVTWKALPPVVQKGAARPFNGSTNRATVAEGSNKSSPQPNLAEFLAASLNENVSETTTM